MSGPHDERLAARRAVESLRSGVPSDAAVRALGSGQEALEGRFRELLMSCQADAERERQSAGMLVAGDFGAGKSHLLAAFEHLALRSDFACSRVVISKETPLHDPAKLLATAVEGLRVPGAVGRGLEEAALRLARRAEAAEYEALLESVADAGRFNSRFPATLYVYDHSRGEPELADRMVRFWSGDKLGVTELRRVLRELGRPAVYPLESIKIRELALQTFSFVPRLLRAAGLRGWVLLLDEVELIGRYGPLQRGRSYAELARWLGADEQDARPGLVTVGAITTDFDRAILVDKGDLDSLGLVLEGRDPAAARRAARGMELIRSAERLSAVDDAVREQAYATLRELHGRAYVWEPPDVASPEALGTTPMRTYVRAWINAWDVRRLYPDADEPESYELTPVASHYGEDAALEEPVDETVEAGDEGREAGVATPPQPAGDAADDW